MPLNVEINAANYALITLSRSKIKKERRKKKKGRKFYLEKYIFIVQLLLYSRARARTSSGKCFQKGELFRAVHGRISRGLSNKRGEPLTTGGIKEAKILVATSER